MRCAVVVMTLAAARIAQDILTKMSAPFTLGDDIAHISASIGITTYPDDGNSAEILMKNGSWPPGSLGREIQS